MAANPLCTIGAPKIPSMLLFQFAKIGKRVDVPDCRKSSRMISAIEIPPLPTHCSENRTITEPFGIGIAIAIAIGCSLLCKSRCRYRCQIQRPDFHAPSGAPQRMRDCFENSSHLHRHLFGTSQIPTGEGVEHRAELRQHICTHM
jgi:hypothetical protein